MVAEALKALWDADLKSGDALRGMGEGAGERGGNPGEGDACVEKAGDFGSVCFLNCNLRKTHPCHVSIGVNLKCTH